MESLGKSGEQEKDVVTDSETNGAILPSVPKIKGRKTSRNKPSRAASDSGSSHGEKKYIC